MYRTSKAYEASMKKMLRERGYMEVTLGVVNKLAQSSAVLNGTFADWSDQTFPLNNADYTTEYLTLEQDWAKADGTLMFMPEPDTAQYYHNRCTVTKDLLGVITIKFNNKYDIKGISLTFGRAYPTSLKIETDSESFTYDNEESEFVSTDVYENTSYIKITPLSMVGGNQRLRLLKIQCGVGLTFSNSDITDSTLEEYASSICEELPSISFSVTVSNMDDKYNVDDSSSFINFLQTGQIVSARYGIELDDGTVEYVPTENLVLSSWQSNGNTMTFVSTDVLQTLNNKYSLGNTIHERTLYQEAKSVLADAGLEPDEYELDDCLRDVTIVNPMPEVTHAEALQMIANAGRCVMYQDRTGRICIRANFTTVFNPNDYTITSSDMADWGTLSNIMKSPSVVYSEFNSDLIDTNGITTFAPEDSSEYSKETSFASAVVADENGDFSENPYIQIDLSGGSIYYILYLNFDGNPAQEIRVTTYYNESLQDDVVFSEIDKETILEYEFATFDRIRFEFTKGYPNNRVLVKTITFGDTTSYTLTKNDMLEKPIGYQETKAKSVSVRQFTFENDEEGNAHQVDDSVYVTESINTVGDAIYFENQLISSASHAESVCTWLGNYLANNISYNVNHRGEPRLNSSDVITMESDYLNNLQVEIEKTTLKFNGGFSGTLEMRRALRVLNT